MNGNYEVCVEADFAAAHCIKGYQGNCARLHGHNWKVQAHLCCSRLNEIGIAVDFREVKKALSEILGEFDHNNLNELKQFQEINPTSENIARYVFQELAKKLNSDNLQVSRVKVSESANSGASYRE